MCALVVWKAPKAAVRECSDAVKFQLDFQSVKLKIKLIFKALNRLAFDGEFTVNVTSTSQ